MRIVLVSYRFTPNTAIAAVRARGLAKYLGRAGHSVTVVTSEPNPESSLEWDVVTVAGRTPSSSARRALGVPADRTIVDVYSGNGRWKVLAWALRGIRGAARELNWPDEAAGWSRRMQGWLTQRIDSGNVDVVISTSPPPSAHLAVGRIARRGTAWVADFRDLWTLNHFYSLSPLRRALDSRFESRVFREADAITVATVGFADSASTAFPDAPISVVYNGYDPEMFENWRRDTPNQRLTLVHAGSLYGGLCDPTILFAALQMLLSTGRVPAEDIHIDFFSLRESWLAQCIAHHGLEDVVTVHGTVPREQVIAAYSAADVLVLIQWDTPAEGERLPAKMLEYLASRRFALCIASPLGGEVDRLIAQTKSGAVVRDADAAAGVIAALYDEFKRTGFVSVQCGEAARAEWTQSAMAQAMQEAIDSAVLKAQTRA